MTISSAVAILNMTLGYLIGAIGWGLLIFVDFRIVVPVILIIWSNNIIQKRGKL